MPIRIEPFTEDHIPAVQDFNRRLAGGGVQEFSFPEHPVMDWLPYAAGRNLYQRPFVAVDEQGTVRGGYILKRQDFLVAGECRSTGFLRLPLSEGVINPAYAGLGVMLVRHAMAQSPLLYCLGMGGMQNPLPRLLTSLRWALEPVPFFFYVVHGARFLRRMPALGGTRLKAMLASVAAFSGTGHAALRTLQALKTRSKIQGTAVTPTRFGTEIDRIWSRSSNQYRFAAVRDQTTARTLYDEVADRAFCRLEIEDAGVPVGWAVMLDTKMQSSKHFGDLRVGTIVDCDAVAGYAGQVVLQSRNWLQSRGVDLIVSNQSHAIWTQAFRGAGFLSVPSNYIFAASKPLATAIGPVSGCHITRGDGDGPIHL